MDTIEFLEQLFDKIENTLKENNNPNFVKQLFAGCFCSQIICENNHVSETDQKFYTIQLDIKNKINIQTSLRGLFFILYY
jgi:hypothetical protein